MRTGPVRLLLLLVLMLPVRAGAEDNVVTLPELEQEALRNNPEIRMAEKRADSSDEKRSLASALPDPMIGYMVQNEGSPFQWTVGGMQTPMSMQGVVFSQEVPFPGKLSTVGKAAAKRAEREHETARETTYRVLANLRSESVDLSRVVVVEGWYDRTLNERTRGEHGLAKVAFAWVDCDLYESTVPVLRFLAPMLSIGSVVLFDDWRCFRNLPDFGQQRAVREWLESTPGLRLSELMSFGWNGLAFAVTGLGDQRRT